MFFRAFAHPQKGRLYIMSTPQPLKRVIRSKDTGKFFKDGDWTDSSDDATNFPSVAEAAQACSEYQMKNAELILCFGSKELDVSVPICQG